MNKWFKFRKRLASEKNQNIFIPFLSVFLGFVIGALVMIVTGHNPIEAYAALLKGAGFFGDIKRLGDTLLNSTTLILTGLSIAFAFKTGLFNIGAPGQMLIGGFAAILVGVKLTLPRIIHVPLVIIAAIVAGALWALIPGLLKAKFNIHEVVTTIMMNWVGMWSVYYFVPTFIPGTYNTESASIEATASLRMKWLSDIFQGSSVNLGLFIAVVAAVIAWWILQKTTFGYELKAVGYNQHSAKYAGMKVDRNIVYSMMIAGAFAGLAGVTFYLGYAENMKIGALPSQGFDGIAVALVGLSNPLGVVLASILFGFMNAGKLFMQSSTDVPNELVPIINGIIIFFAAANLMIKGWLQKINKQLNKEEGGL